MLTSSLYKNLLDGLQNVTASVHSCTLHLSWSRHRMTYLLYPMTTSWRAECYSTNDALWGPAALQTIAQLIFVDRHSGYSISRCLLPAVLVYIFTSLWTAQTIIRHQRSTALRLVTHCVIQASIILFHVQSKQWPKLSWSALVLMCYMSTLHGRALHLILEVTESSWMVVSTGGAKRAIRERSVKLGFL